MAEADLYRPVKQFLEAQGYAVKGEIGPCDVVAVRGEGGPVVVELKERLSLSLVLQAVNRLTVSDVVYVAFRIGKGHSATWRSQGKHVVHLLRRLGLGLLTVSSRGRVVPVLDPAPYRPRTRPRDRTEAAEGVRRTCRQSRSRRLRLLRPPHSLSTGRAPVRARAGCCGCPQGQRPQRQDRSRPGRAHRARQPLWMVRAGEGRPLRLVAEGRAWIEALVPRPAGVVAVADRRTDGCRSLHAI